MKISPAPPDGRDFDKRGLSGTHLVLAGSLFLLLTGNLAFFQQLTQTYPWGGANAAFLVSVALVLGCEIVLLTLLLSLVIPLRATLSLLFLITAVTAYFSDQFGTIIDTVMIGNTLQTSPSEASDLLTGSFGLRVLLLGFVPIALIWSLPFRRVSYARALRSKLLLALASVVLMAACILMFSSQYASFVREHKAFRFYTNPAFPLYSTFKYVTRPEAHQGSGELIDVEHDARISTSDPHAELIIMVVGETARRDHFSLNGYKRNTNPGLSREPNLYSYSHITACGTSTAVAVPCMFALSGRDTFDMDEAAHTENVLDILQRVGVRVLWRDNNSSAKRVADRVQYEDFQIPENNPVCDVECRDVGMLHGLQEFIDEKPGDVLIVLHQMGNHGPAYYKRYPAEFERFTPACQSAELSECTDEEIINAYDNAILYTDYFLEQVIALLKANTPRYETAMLYLSDHGESLGENGLYLHGMPYVLAPAEQIDIPLLLWIGGSSDVYVPSVLANENRTNSQDAIFQSLLSLFEVETDLKNVPKGLFDMKEN